MLYWPGSWVQPYNTRTPVQNFTVTDIPRYKLQHIKGQVLRWYTIITMIAISSKMIDVKITPRSTNKPTCWICPCFDLFSAVWNWHHKQQHVHLEVNNNAGTLHPKVRSYRPINWSLKDTFSDLFLFQLLEQRCHLPRKERFLNGSRNPGTILLSWKLDESFW